MEPIYENDEHIGLCSTKALVSALWSGPSRATSIVWADDSVVRLRCDVIVDRIHAVEIITTTRELFLEDAPEVKLMAKHSNVIYYSGFYQHETGTGSASEK